MPLTEGWLPQVDDLRTFLAEFVSKTTRVELLGAFERIIDFEEYGSGGEEHGHT